MTMTHLAKHPTCIVHTRHILYLATQVYKEEGRDGRVLNGQILLLSPAAAVPAASAAAPSPALAPASDPACAPAPAPAASPNNF